jgi:hypothetical protein
MKKRRSDLIIEVICEKIKSDTSVPKREIKIVRSAGPKISKVIK